MSIPDLVKREWQVRPARTESLCRCRPATMHSPPDLPRTRATPAVPVSPPLLSVPLPLPALVLLLLLLSAGVVNSQPVYTLMGIGFVRMAPGPP